MTARVVVLPADLDQALADRIRPVVTETIDAGRDLVIDMRAAGTIDSAGLGLLVRAHRSAKQRGATLSLVGPSRFVLTVLHTMRLDGVFTIRGEEEPEEAAA
ncbi:STAS domain-containing protein [Actinoplanes subglobosus]|uniref:STAS domain-containing protein n=1 Tax=Actinoplanes subglobosus TaxID=1547892 RepID=A0ABV8J1X8_9ACTN